MANLTIIAAVGKNFELGKDNDLIWKIKEDMKFFKEYTWGKKIIMGSNTFYSLPGLLPNRKHIVITSKNLDIGSEVLVVHSIEELLEYLKSINEEVMIIGGARVYSELLSFSDKMILTEINSNVDASVYFPRFDYSEWVSEIIGEYETSELIYKRVMYKRK